MAFRAVALALLLALVALSLPTAFLGGSAKAPITSMPSLGAGQVRSAQSGRPSWAKASQSFAGAATLPAISLLAVGAALARRATLTARRVRLVGKEIPRNLPIVYALVCSIYGCGKTTSFKIVGDCGIDPTKRTSELTEDEEVRLAEELSKYVLENPLRRMYKSNCNQLLQVKHVRGVRMAAGLPVRGQRSKTNKRTANKLNPSRTEMKI
eukprot:TRINITY_DN13580_c0_g1_i4.p1 TRINITY_DN13580_c0_g1~~TRINITY_DN13580_c0_g1_i4.p1  ORF type:complete len:232 (-),score=39.56 TRINITY_DN13580_c0_g1_i4:165-794(-)